MPQSLLTVGVLADTHLPYRLKALPPEIADVFRGVDLILHAGDVDRLEYMAPLAELAPLYAVRGNIHLGDLSDGGRALPDVIELTLAGRRVVLTHGHRSDWYELLLKVPPALLPETWRPTLTELNRRIVHRLAGRYPTADVVVFGHTHRACCVRRNGTLYFNPGPVAAVRDQVSSVGLLTFGPGGVEARIVPLSLNLR